jgi:hypothetical protein
MEATMPISVGGTIPGGRVEVVDASDPADVRLRLALDGGSEFRGHFHFRATGVRGLACNFSLLNAGDTLATRLPGRDDVENAFTNTGPMASYDRVNWFRLPSTFDGQNTGLATPPTTTSAIMRAGPRMAWTGCWTCWRGFSSLKGFASGPSAVACRGRTSISSQSARPGLAS